MEKFIEYAPSIIVVIAFAAAYKVFATPKQLAELKSQLIEYISEHYVSEKSCDSCTKHIEGTLKTVTESIQKLDEKLDMKIDKVTELIERRIEQAERGH